MEHIAERQTLGAEVVLLVPGVVNPETVTGTRGRVRRRSSGSDPALAQEMKVIVGMEEVWNKFLISPLEMARYVDEFNSPW